METEKNSLKEATERENRTHRKQIHKNNPNADPIRGTAFGFFLCLMTCYFSRTIRP